MLARPLLFAGILGTSLSIAATGTVSLGLVVTMTLAWSFVVLIQVVASVAIIATARARVLPLARAFDAFFALHLPWSLWILAYAAWAWVTLPAGRHSNWMLWTAIIPVVWTGILIYRFCRQTLAESHRGALVRTCLHQTIVWGAFLIIGGAAVGLWPRVVGVVGR